MKISILIGTYGDAVWSRLAESRAHPSTYLQNADEVLMEHQAKGTIATCRNDLAAKAIGDYLCFLDADDELGDGFIDEMRAELDIHDWNHWRWPMFTPRVSYTRGNRTQAPKFWPERPLSEGNWLIIGTLVPRPLFLQVGGFPEVAHGYEDWALFAKCEMAGASIVKVPGAVYIAHVMPGSRNRRMSRETAVRQHYEIGKELWPERYSSAWLEQHLQNARRADRSRR